MPNYDPVRAEHFARVECDVQRLDFDLVTEGLKSVPSRAGPILGAALVVAGLGADYIYRLHGSVELGMLILCGLLAAAALVWTIIFASLALAVANVEEPAPLPTPTKEQVSNVPIPIGDAQADEQAEHAVSDAELSHIRARVNIAAQTSPSVLGSLADALLEHAEAMARWNTKMTVKLNKARGHMIYAFGGLVALTVVVIFTFVLRVADVTEPDPKVLPSTVQSVVTSANASIERVEAEVTAAKQSADDAASSAKAESLHIHTLDQAIHDLTKKLGKMHP